MRNATCVFNTLCTYNVTNMEGSAAPGLGNSLLFLFSLLFYCWLWSGWGGENNSARFISTLCFIPLPSQIRCVTCAQCCCPTSAASEPTNASTLASPRTAVQSAAHRVVLPTCRSTSRKTVCTTRARLGTSE